MSALRKLFSLNNLYASWKSMQSKFLNTTSSGVDGQTKSDFVKNLDREIASISSDVLSGSYKFSDLRAISIDKANGKIRLINVPTIRDRFVQRVLIDFFRKNYSENWKIGNSFSSMGGFAFRESEKEGAHHTLKNISQKIKHNHFVIRADLSKFFDTINRSQLKSLVKKRVRHWSLHPLIFDCIECETDLQNAIDKKNFDNAGLKVGNGIRQGMPISPVLAYLFLSKQDLKFEKVIFRYVDDLIFYANSHAEVSMQFEKYKKIVETMGLNIHPLSTEADAKTKLFGPKDQFEFLGIVLERLESGNKFKIPKASKNKIKTRAQNSCKFPYDNINKQKRWLLSSSLRVSNLVRDYRTAYHLCDDWSAFEKELGELQVSLCRSIATEVSMLKKGPKKFLLRAFGV